MECKSFKNDLKEAINIIEEHIGLYGELNTLEEKMKKKTEIEGLMQKAEKHQRSFESCLKRMTKGTPEYHKYEPKLQKLKADLKECNSKYMRLQLQLRREPGFEGEEYTDEGDRQRLMENDRGLKGQGATINRIEGMAAESAKEMTEANLLQNEARHKIVRVAEVNNRIGMEIETADKESRDLQLQQAKQKMYLALLIVLLGVVAVLILCIKLFRGRK